MKKFKFKFGDIVQHKDIEFRGEIEGRVEYSDGHKKYGIRLNDDSPSALRQPYRWVAENFLKLYKEN